MTGKIIPSKNIIEVRQGDTFVIKLQFHKQSAEIDLHDAQIMMQVRRKDDDSLLFSLEALPIEAEKGKFSFVLSPVQTGLAEGEYKTDMQIILNDGSVHTFFPADVNQIGIFRITQQVTK
ncbi:MAG: hypothetical protein Q4D80_02570 [Pseudomonadota bacterium]|nr:hypothetical protein [Pseudomonadota bacterium]